MLYVRLDGNPTDQLVVSKDGGATWTKVFETKTPVLGATSPLLGFALSPDGSMVAAGGPVDGLWTAPASTLAFTQVSTMSALCLTWSPAGLYGCADEMADGFTAGISTDQGKTWTPLLHLAGLCGPLACGADERRDQALHRFSGPWWPPASAPRDAGARRAAARRRAAAPRRAAARRRAAATPAGTAAARAALSAGPRPGSPRCRPC